MICHEGSKCELSCNCLSSSCQNLFKGCQCLKNCNGRSCPCYSEDRLCNPYVCWRCTSICGNTKKKLIISNDYKFRLVIGNSNIHGTGLFTLDRIPADTFLREYTGEFISDEEEISKRGKQNVIAKTTYMFSLADPTTIDSMYMGNKTRFCNHSTIYDNVIVKVKFNNIL